MNSLDTTFQNPSIISDASKKALEKQKRTVREMQEMLKELFNHITLAGQKGDTKEVERLKALAPRQQEQLAKEQALLRQMLEPKQNVATPAPALAETAPAPEKEQKQEEQPAQNPAPAKKTKAEQKKEAQETELADLRKSRDAYAQAYLEATSIDDKVINRAMQVYMERKLVAIQTGTSAVQPTPIEVANWYVIECDAAHIDIYQTPREKDEPNTLVTVKDGIIGTEPNYLDNIIQGIWHPQNNLTYERNLLRALENVLRGKGRCIATLSDLVQNHADITSNNFVLALDASTMKIEHFPFQVWRDCGGAPFIQPLKFDFDPQWLAWLQQAMQEGYTYEGMQQHLRDNLPQTVLDYLTPHLVTGDGDKYSDWENLIAVMEATGNCILPCNGNLTSGLKASWVFSGVKNSGKSTWLTQIMKLGDQEKGRPWYSGSIPAVNDRFGDYAIGCKGTRRVLVPELKSQTISVGWLKAIASAERPEMEIKNRNSHVPHNENYSIAQIICTNDRLDFQGRESSDSLDDKIITCNWACSYVDKPGEASWKLTPEDFNLTMNLALAFLQIALYKKTFTRPRPDETLYDADDFTDLILCFEQGRFNEFTNRKQLNEILYGYFNEFDIPDAEYLSRGTTKSYTTKTHNTVCGRLIKRFGKIDNGHGRFYPNCILKRDYWQWLNLQPEEQYNLAEQ